MNNKFALNLSDNGRVMSATFDKYAPEDLVRVDGLPDGDISDYRYVNSEYIYDPLPKTEPLEELTQEERIKALEEKLAITEILLGVE